MLLRQALFACVSVAVFGCSSPEAGSDVKIVGGNPVAGDKWPATVALTRNGGASCTATLVTPLLAITAAHCLDDGPSRSALGIVVGNEIRGGESHRVASYKINPRYADNALSDFAYVKLAEPVQNVKFVQVLTDPDEIRTLLAPGTPSTMVGFGWSVDNKQGEIGTKYETTSRVGRSPDGALFIGGAGRDTCQGDSGGSAYGQLPNGEWRVYGITSRGPDCGSGGTYARMADGLCFIQQDSGIAVPGSKLDCPGVTNVPFEGGAGTGTGTGTLLAKDLHLLLGNERTDVADAYDIFLAGEKVTAKVSLCFGDKASCVASKKEDLAFRKAEKQASDLTYFQSATALRLRDGGLVTLLGFDASGQLVQANALQFKAGRAN